MVRLSALAQAERDHLVNLPCLLFDTQQAGPRFRSNVSRLFRRRVSKGATIDRSLAAMRAIVFHGIPRHKIVMSQISVNFDRSGCRKASMSFSRWNA